VAATAVAVATEPVEAVVLDIGGVLEINDDSLFPPEIPDITLLQGDALRGKVSAQHVRDVFAREIGLDEAGLDELFERFWRWYVGELDVAMAQWFAGLRDRGLRTGILSNSGPGAREAERHHGFDEMCDVLVYSHEVGRCKPDPEVYALMAEQLGVEPQRIAFLDDWEDAVEGARAAGWQAIHHRDREQSIRDIESLLTGGAR
jgi:putative hydrolase of the HAD superfamily